MSFNLHTRVNIAIKQQIFRKHNIGLGLEMLIRGSLGSHKRGRIPADRESLDWLHFMDDRLAAAVSFTDNVHSVVISQFTAMTYDGRTVVQNAAIYGIVYRGTMHSMQVQPIGMGGSAQVHPNQNSVCRRKANICLADKDGQLKGLDSHLSGLSSPDLLKKYLLCATCLPRGRG